MTRVIVCRSKFRQTDFYHEPADDDPAEPACRFSGRSDMDFTPVDRESLHDDAEKCRFCAGTAHNAGGQGSKLAAKLADTDPDEVTAP